MAEATVTSIGIRISLQCSRSSVTRSNTLHASSWSTPQQSMWSARSALQPSNPVEYSWLWAQL